MNEVLYHVENAVATVTLNRPDRKIGLTAEMLSQLFSTLAHADDDVAVRSIVLRGAGGVFSAGGDVAVEATGDTARKPLSNFGDMAAAAIRIRKPIVAAIETYCIGGALAVAMLCDVRFASRDTIFSAAFTRIGVAAELGIAWTLPRLVGCGVAMDILLSSRQFDAEEAHRLGVINYLSSSDLLYGDAFEYADELAQRSPTSMWTIKEQVLAAYDQTLADSHMAAAVEGPDWNEGYRAFLESAHRDLLLCGRHHPARRYETSR